MNNTIEVNGISITKLRVYKYVLNNTYICETDLFQDVNVNTDYYSIDEKAIGVIQNYKYDGPSGPALDTPNFMRASLIHDVLYQAIREGELSMKHRKTADLMMYRIAREDGMGRIRANYTYYALRAFGQKAAIRGLAEQR